jgi:uncharacterized membrane protein
MNLHQPLFLGMMVMAAWLGEWRVLAVDGQLWSHIDADRHVWHSVKVHKIDVICDGVFHLFRWFIVNNLRLELCRCSFTLRDEWILEVSSSCQLVRGFLTIASSPRDLHERILYLSFVGRRTADAFPGSTNIEPEVA